MAENVRSQQEDMPLEDEFYVPDEMTAGDEIEGIAADAAYDRWREEHWS